MGESIANIIYKPSQNILRPSKVKQSKVGLLWKVDFVKFSSVLPNFFSEGKLGIMLYLCSSLKDTHMENTPSNKTEALTKSKNMYIWAIGTLNQLFIRGSYILKLNLQKRWSGQWHSLW